MCIHVCKGKGMFQNLKWGGCREGAAMEGGCVCVCTYVRLRARARMRVCVPCMHACMCRSLPTHARHGRGRGPQCHNEGWGNVMGSNGKSKQMARERGKKKRRARV